MQRAPCLKEDRLASSSAEPCYPENLADGRAGPIVCACFGVGQRTIENFIAAHQGCDANAIGVTLKAGTNCGCCVPELKTADHRAEQQKRPPKNEFAEAVFDLAVAAPHA